MIFTSDIKKSCIEPHNQKVSNGKSFHVRLQVVDLGVHMNHAPQPPSTKFGRNSPKVKSQLAESQIAAEEGLLGLQGLDLG